MDHDHTVIIIVISMVSTKLAIVKWNAQKPVFFPERLAGRFRFCDRGGIISREEAFVYELFVDKSILRWVLWVARGHAKKASEIK